MQTFTKAASGRRSHGHAIIGSIATEYPPQKQTHKLAPMCCVLWLRDLGGYLRASELASGNVRTTTDPGLALRLAEDLAYEIGQTVVDATGLRVELRPYRAAVEVQPELFGLA